MPAQAASFSVRSAVNPAAVASEAASWAESTVSGVSFESSMPTYLVIV